ncbi:MAG: MBL fold metallo-hydrolase [Candidatus Polarisedimenticolaceae bacterium]|nr:MBL fold metallo-hydrolase [Candidatus Polarisedimenticolaceae bacterium]
MTDQIQKTIAVTSLGQVGFRLVFGDTVVYIDPYLSDHVAQVEGGNMKRMFPVPFTPGSVVDAEWVFISHDHIDHCDPLTIKPLSSASRKCCFVCTSSVAEKLLEWGVSGSRIISAIEGEWVTLSPVLRVTTVPAAHPEICRDRSALALCVGFIFEYEGRRLYHAGDTSITDELLVILKQFMPIDVAFLPVNERNYFRERQGIIGNMTIREAFGLAEEIAARVMVPTHWDMFASNQVYREEIELLYKLINPEFKLSIHPQTL